MSKAELRKLTELLKAKRAEIGRTLLQREEIAIQQVPDAIDQTQLTVERELRHNPIGPGSFDAAEPGRGFASPPKWHLWPLSQL